MAKLEYIVELEHEAEFNGQKYALFKCIKVWPDGTRLIWALVPTPEAAHNLSDRMRDLEKNLINVGDAPNDYAMKIHNDALTRLHELRRGGFGPYGGKKWEGK